MDLLVPLLTEDGEEMIIFDQILAGENRTYHYLDKRPGKFLLEELDDNFCFLHFRFYKSDIRRLRVLFEVPDVIILENRINVSGEEALCILLKRLAYPNRYVDMMQFFPRGKSALCAIFNGMVEHILSAKGHILNDLNGVWMSNENVRMFCSSISRRGSPYPRCFGFLDGTLRPICRPTYHQREFYNGHKKVHGLKFQSLILPNGIIANLFGPVQGRRHDSHVLAKSRLLNKIRRRFGGFRSPPYVYSDTGYPLRKYLMVPFQNQLNRRQRNVNKIMSKLRISVEWGFAKIIQIFPFLDFRKNLKVYKQRVSDYYKIGAILTNCHTCLYGGQVCQYFDCEPPQLEDYLG